MTRVFAAFFRALVSQLHPRMLALLVGPFIVAVVFWILVALFAWDPLIEFLRVGFFEGGGVLQVVFDWIASIFRLMSSVAVPVSLASSLTSLATTAKPLPASPARAASMLAFRASSLV